MTAHRSPHQSPTRSRRAVLGAGGAITAAFLSGSHAAANQATPTTGDQDALFVQSFGSGSLFRTQGSGPDLPPYTLYLWDAAASTIFITVRPELSTGLILTEHVLSLVSPAGEAPIAALVASPEDGEEAGEEAVWLLRLTFAGAGSDPNSLTYQGDLLTADEAAALLDRPALAPPPDGEQGLGSGSLFLIGVSAPEVDASVQIRLP